MTNNALKPCPFCGGEAYIEKLMGREHIKCRHTVNCLVKPSTWLQSAEKLSKQIKGWNRRDG